MDWDSKMGSELSRVISSDVEQIGHQVFSSQTQIQIQDNTDLAIFPHVAS